MLATLASGNTINKTPKRTTHIYAFKLFIYLSYQHNNQSYIISYQQNNNQSYIISYQHNNQSYIHYILSTKQSILHYILSTQQSILHYNIDMLSSLKQFIHNLFVNGCFVHHNACKIRRRNVIFIFHVI